MRTDRCSIALATLLVAACASRPTVEPASLTDCRQLGAALAETDQARQAALEKQQGAWKVVLPFAVVARYAAGKAEVTEADEQRAKLEHEMNDRGCGPR